MTEIRNCMYCISSNECLPRINTGPVYVPDVQGAVLVTNAGRQTNTGSLGWVWHEVSHILVGVRGDTFGLVMHVQWRSSIVVMFIAVLSIRSCIHNGHQSH